MKNPKGFRGKYFSLAAILALSTTITLANETKSYTDTKQNSEEQVEYTETEELTPPSDELNAVIISKKIKVKEVDAPFASEIYTKAKIEKSRAKDVYEFLNTQTSVTLAPSYGNKFSQLIDMRGYGLANGYQNVVISVDGRRLNNIDGAPQLLGSIPIESIEKIEIIKGSGSVEYGDGANAGVINIITKGYEGASVKTYVGDNGLLFGSLGLGIKRDKFSLSGYIDDYRHDGYKEVNVDGTKDDSDAQNKGISATFTPIENLTFNLGKTFSDMQVKYSNALTLDEYENDIKAIKGYTEHIFSSDVLSYGLKYDITDKVALSLQATDEDKVSNFVTYSSKSDYEYKTYEAKIDYKDENFNALLGTQKFDGIRKSSTNDTSKDNLGFYAKADYSFSNNLISFGARSEKVKYDYTSAGSSQKDEYSLQAYDLGYNYKLNKISSFFVNLNQSFQAPNIDAFFEWGGAFNAFIKPMKVKTINGGYSHLSYPNKFKFSAFYSDVEDEIYYNSVTWQNTNLDKTEKYGFELYDKYNILYNLFATLNYAYVDTKIKEDEANPDIVGNEIPGVSKHNVKVGLGYNPTHRVNLLLSHVYKSEAYAMSDFDHNYGKMDAYNSTDFSATYKYKKFEFFAKINNLLDEKNALFVDGGFSVGVYPVNYERNFMVGLSAKF
jgi:iron complex outermembrane receptor protein